MRDSPLFLPTIASDALKQMDETTLLLALQHADSSFPSGSASFSWGLESLCRSGHVHGAADLERFVVGQLRHRWATFDWPFVAAAYRAAPDLERVLDLDHLAAGITVPRELREGAARTGAALLNIHERLGTPCVASYRRLVRTGRAHGYLPVVQGLVWAIVGLTEPVAAAISANGLCVAVTSAALRLGVIRYIDAQRIIAIARPHIVDLLRTTPVEPREASCGTLMIEIASMRHEAESVRLFAN